MLGSGVPVLRVVARFVAWGARVCAYPTQVAWPPATLRRSARPRRVASSGRCPCSWQGIKALNADPAAEITDPADGATVTCDEVVSLRGVATDPETDPTSEDPDGGAVTLEWA
jgi:hypothetical protein